MADAKLADRTFVRGLSVIGPAAAFGLEADQSTQFADGETAALTDAQVAVLEAQAPGCLAPVKGGKAALGDWDKDGVPGGDAAAAKA